MPWLLPHHSARHTQRSLHNCSSLASSHTHACLKSSEQISKSSAMCAARARLSAYVSGACRAARRGLGPACSARASRKATLVCFSDDLDWPLQRLENPQFGRFDRRRAVTRNSGQRALFLQNSYKARRRSPPTLHSLHTPIKHNASQYNTTPP